MARKSKEKTEVNTAYFNPYTAISAITDEMYKRFKIFPDMIYDKELIYTLKSIRPDASDLLNNFNLASITMMNIESFNSLIKSRYNSNCGFDKINYGSEYIEIKDIDKYNNRNDIIVLMLTINRPNYKALSEIVNLNLDSLVNSRYMDKLEQIIDISEDDRLKTDVCNIIEKFAGKWCEVASTIENEREQLKKKLKIKFMDGKE